MESAVTALEQSTPAVEKACTPLKEGKKNIEKQIGGRTMDHNQWWVSEYEEDEYSDDEKTLFRAEDRMVECYRMPFRASVSGSTVMGSQHSQSDVPALLSLQEVLPQFEVPKKDLSTTASAQVQEHNNYYV